MVLTPSEIPRFKQMGKRKDSRALMAVQDMLEVMGHRIGNQPHW